VPFVPWYRSPPQEVHTMGRPSRDFGGGVIFGDFGRYIWRYGGARRGEVVQPIGLSAGKRNKSKKGHSLYVEDINRAPFTSLAPISPKP
jgi:hypothetical protein